MTGDELGRAGEFLDHDTVWKTRLVSSRHVQQRCPLMPAIPFTSIYRLDITKTRELYHIGSPRKVDISIGSALLRHSCIEPHVCYDDR